MKKILLEIADSDPLIVQLSTYFKNLLSNSEVHSVLPRIDFNQIGVNIF